MTKKEFLKALEKELIHHNIDDITSIVEYYDELIEDKIESGVKEKDVIDELSITDIVRNVKAHRTIEDATQKPSISNGMKALMAFLGVLSFPMLLVMGTVLFALLIAMISIVFAVFVTFGALLFGAGVAFIILLGALVSGNIPFFPALFGLGLALFLVGVFGMLVKWTLTASREIMAWFINLIDTKFRKKVGNND